LYLSFSLSLFPSLHHSLYFFIYVFLSLSFFLPLSSGSSLTQYSMA
jgi:hypothetical protein